MGQFGIVRRNQSGGSSQWGREMRGNRDVLSGFLGDKCNGVWVEFIFKAKGT